MKHDFQILTFVLTRTIYPYTVTCRNSGDFVTNLFKINKKLKIDLSKKLFI